MMITGTRNSLKFLLLLAILCRVVSPSSVSTLCEFSFEDNYKLYNYNLASSIPQFPHGVLSEDGFYKVTVNKSVLWFQLCEGMIFNHDMPRCLDCHDCGGQSRCGMECSALVSNNVQGYHVCTTIGHLSSLNIEISDKRNPHKGVIVKMTNGGTTVNCSLSVSVICDSNVLQEPNLLERTGLCDYVTVLKHPSGCANIVSVHGKRLGWFGTFIIIILCIFGVYLLAGAVYRYFYLQVRGIDVIPNLDFWAKVPERTQSMYSSLARKLRGPSHGHRSSYSPVNF